jgi:hypothetical protein
MDGAQPGCGGGYHGAASRGGSLRCGGRGSGSGGGCLGEESVGSGGDDGRSCGDGVHGNSAVMSEEQDQEAAVVAYAKVRVVVLGKEQDQVARGSGYRGKEPRENEVKWERRYHTCTDIPALWHSVVDAGLVALWLVVLTHAVGTC